MTDRLSAGRVALEQRDWEAGFTLLSSLDDEAELTAADLEQIGDAAFWTGRNEQCIRYRERSFTAYRRQGLVREAARVALPLVWDYFTANKEAVARGWLAKVHRLLENEPECREQGTLALWRAELEVFAGQLDSALSRAREALALGERIGDPDLQAHALCFEGNVLLRIGETAEGIARIDESMATAVSGELTPWTTAAIYCVTLSACQRIGDVRRASEWSDVAEQCTHRPGMQDFPGDCRAHRIGLLRIKGQWDAVETAVERITQVRGAEPSHMATVFQELGLVRLSRGQFDGAEEAFCRAEELGRTPQPGRALLCLAQRDVDAAMAFISGALADQTWDRLARARLLPAHVSVALAAGSPADARRAADELEDIADTYGTISFRAAAASADGCVLVAEGDSDQGGVRLRQAIDLWMQLPAPFEAASNRLSLAQMLRNEGRLHEARAEARAAQTALARLGAAPHAARAAALLEDIENASLTRQSKSTRVTHTFMFTDIVGSTSLIEVIGDDAWRDLLRWHDRVLREQFTGHAGEEIDHAGDGFFVAFATVDAALDCAVAIQRELQRNRQEHGYSPRVRIGVHCAEASRDERGLSGKGVHHAARIGAIAAADEIIVSAPTAQAAETARAYGAARRVELKGITEAATVFPLSWSE